MSYAERAVILIRLDARVGTWVPIADLAAHCGLPVETVRQRVSELWQGGLAQAQWDTAGDTTVMTAAMAIGRVRRQAMGGRGEACA